MIMTDLAVAILLTAALICALMVSLKTVPKYKDPGWPQLTIEEVMGE